MDDSPSIKSRIRHVVGIEEKTTRQGEGEEEKEKEVVFVQRRRVEEEKRDRYPTTLTQAWTPSRGRSLQQTRDNNREEVTLETQHIDVSVLNALPTTIRDEVVESMKRCDQIQHFKQKEREKERGQDRERQDSRGTLRKTIQVPRPWIQDNLDEYKMPRRMSSWLVQEKWTTRQKQEMRQWIRHSVRMDLAGFMRWIRMCKYGIPCKHITWIEHVMKDDVSSIYGCSLSITSHI